MGNSLEYIILAISLAINLKYGIFLYKLYRYKKLARKVKKAKLDGNLDQKTIKQFKNSKSKIKGILCQ